MELNSRRIRLEVDIETLDAMKDRLRSGTPENWQGGDLDIELGFFENDALLDVSDVASVTAYLCESGAVVLSKSSGALNNALTEQEWTDNTDQHAVISFDQNDMNFMVTDKSRQFELYIELLTLSESKRIPAGSTNFLLRKFCRDDTAVDPENPDSPLTQSQGDALYYKEGNPLTAKSLAVSDPGVHGLDEAVAELEGTTLVVPSPGKGNVLLVRRSTGGTPGGDEITAFTGLSQGTLYWLVHNDGATDPIRFTGMLIRDGAGGPIPIRATSATTAVLAAPTTSTYSWGGNETQTGPPGPSFLRANGDATDTLLSLTDNEVDHVALRPGRITAASVRLEQSTVGSNVELHVAVNGTVEQIVTLSNAQAVQVVDLDVTVSKGDRIAVGPKGTGEAPGQTIVTLIAQQD